VNNGGVERQKSLGDGGAGFIGSHLVEALCAQGANVTVLDNLQAGCWENLGPCRSAVTTVEGDVRDEKCVGDLFRETGPEFVLHLAANASVPGSVEDPVYDFQSNAAGTFVVLNAVRSVLPEASLVIASSGAVYGEPESFPLTEDSPLKPISPYGASKLCAEHEARLFARVYGVNVKIARLFNTYGPRMPRFVVFDFLKKLQSHPRHLEILGTGKQVRDLNFVTDTVQGVLLLALCGESGHAYNIASGTSYTVTEIAERLLRILGLTGTQLHYTGESWSGDAQHWEVAIDALKELGYNPQVPLSDGLRRVQKWFADVHGKKTAGV